MPRQDVIAKLVKEGEVFRGEAGVYFSDDDKPPTAKERATMEGYDIATLLKECPNILKFRFRTVKGKVEVVYVDGETGKTVELDAGKSLPKDTQALVDLVNRKHAEDIDQGLLKETAELFEDL